MGDAKMTASRRGVIGSATVGALMLGAFATRAEAKGWSAEEKANVKVVNDFLKMAEGHDAAAPMAFVASDAVYRMTETSPPDKGHDAIVKRLKTFVDTADAISLKVLSTFAAGPIVINHRIDKFTSKTRPLLFEGVGVFFLKDGKIKEWTDYTIRAALANEWPKA